MKFNTLLILVSTLMLLLWGSCTEVIKPPPPNGGPDTTSHNFTFETFVLGDGNSSILYDVAIINDTLAYAVGEIYLKDSTGQFETDAYNAAKWNGIEWELKRIPFVGPCSAVLYPPIRTIWALSENDILLSNGGSIVNYDGVNATMDCRMNQLLTGAINRIYAGESQKIYAVGNSGAIVYYDGNTWQTLSSGTTLNVSDIWGSGDEILAVASTASGMLDRTVLQITGTNVQAISDSGIVKEPMTGLWFSMNKKYYVVGSGIYRKNLLSDKLWIGAPNELTEYFSSDVAGTDTNDVVVVGSFGDFLHYNGSSWQNYPELQMNGSFRRVAMKNNLVIAVGSVNPQAIAVIGKR